VALIRTDVSEDRIASIFRVTEYEQVQSETVSSGSNIKEITNTLNSAVSSLTKKMCVLYGVGLVM
jgi:hypothetical protein